MQDVNDVLGPGRNSKLVNLVLSRLDLILAGVGKVPGVPQ